MTRIFRSSFIAAAVAGAVVVALPLSSASADVKPSSYAFYTTMVESLEETLEGESFDWEQGLRTMEFEDFMKREWIWLVSVYSAGHPVLDINKPLNIPPEFEQEANRHMYHTAMLWVLVNPEKSGSLTKADWKAIDAWEAKGKG